MLKNCQIFGVYASYSREKGRRLVRAVDDRILRNKKTVEAGDSHSTITTAPELVGVGEILKITNPLLISLFLDMYRFRLQISCDRV